MPCGGRDLRRTRDLVLTMVRFGRTYEGDHLHWVFRKPVTEFHALTTEVLIVPQRNNKMRLTPPSAPVYKVNHSSNSPMAPNRADNGLEVQRMGSGGSFVVGGGLRGRFGMSLVSQRSDVSRSIKLQKDPV